MNDSAIKTIGKCIGSIVSACLLGLIFEFLLLLAFAWFMDFGLFLFLLIGSSVLLPTITLVPVGGTIFLSRLFNNRVASVVFCIIVSIWLLVTTIEFWGYLSQFDLSDSDTFKAITITLVMAGDIFTLFISAFTNEK